MISSERSRDSRLCQVSPTDVRHAQKPHTVALPNGIGVGVGGHQLVEKTNRFAVGPHSQRFLRRLLKIQLCLVAHLRHLPVMRQQWIIGGQDFPPSSLHTTPRRRMEHAALRKEHGIVRHFSDDDVLE